MPFGEDVLCGRAATERERERETVGVKNELCFADGGYWVREGTVNWCFVVSYNVKVIDRFSQIALYLKNINI